MINDILKLITGEHSELSKVPTIETCLALHNTYWLRGSDEIVMNLSGEILHKGSKTQNPTDLVSVHSQIPEALSSKPLKEVNGHQIDENFNTWYKSVDKLWVGWKGQGSSSVDREIV